MLLLLLMFYTITLICRRHVDPNGFPYLLRTLKCPKCKIWKHFQKGQVTACQNRPCMPEQAQVAVPNLGTLAS